MKPRAALTTVLLALSLAACAFGYYASGTLSDRPGEMRGKAFPGSISGGGRFVLDDVGGLLHCEGDMAAADKTPRPDSCEGESGQGVIRCSDGRIMMARWTGISCRAIQGEAIDAQGNRLTFRVERRR